MQPPDRLLFAKAWVAAEDERGRTYGPQIVDAPPSEWRSIMASDPAYRSYGTLAYLIDYAHGALEDQPSVARELVAAVLEVVDAVDVPAETFAVWLRGCAWKEYANALQVTGDLRRALIAATHAVEILDQQPTLLDTKAAAQLALAQVLQELGESDAAIAIARQCAEVFRDYGQSEYVGYARMTEASILFARKQFREAMAIFTQLAREAEESGDRLALARALLDTGECARELGDITAARTLYSRALENYQGFNVATELPRTRWAYALTLAEDGRPRDAISELFKVRAEYLRFGMNTDAALASLDVVRIKSMLGENVAHSAAELVETFAKAGMTQNAIEALAYLRERAGAGRISEQTFSRVTSYLRELQLRPAAVFLRPPEEER
jgi:tetratricopeptide (TPR) repeat protein